VFTLLLVLFSVVFPSSDSERPTSSREGPRRDQAAHTAPDPAILKSEFIYETAPTPQCHASTIVQTADGLVAAWFGGEHERHPDVKIWVSRLDHGSWTTPVAVADGLQPDGKHLPTWNPVLFQPRGSALMLFYKVGPSPSTWWGMVRSSDDNGRTWSAARRLPDGVLGPIKNKPVQFPSGLILSGSSTEDHGWRVQMERSTDSGKTWHVVGPLNDGQTIGAIQPTLLQYAGGRVQAIGRTRQNRIFTTDSTDEGASWTPMTLLDLPNPSSGIDAVTLTDGRQLLVYNHTVQAERDKGRATLNVALSDDGRRWQAALVLEHEPGDHAGFSYPAVIQTSDGLVHATYTWKRTRIRHVVIDPAKLTLRPIVNGAWPKE
jgi:predicted neuraminidase